jgi:pimeloyl-ACP methyl ester carboxylesterase
MGSSLVHPGWLPVQAPTVLCHDRCHGESAKGGYLGADADNVRLEHTLALFRAIPNAELCIVPGSSHLVILDKPELVNGLILNFLDSHDISNR